MIREMRKQGGFSCGVPPVVIMLTPASLLPLLVNTKTLRLKKQVYIKSCSLNFKGGFNNKSISNKSPKEGSNFCLEWKIHVKIGEAFFFICYSS